MSMSTAKRGRACEACSKIKTKCSLGADPEATLPCERCLRLGKACVLSKPQRQKDRVQELEAKVAALTQLLQAQGITEPELDNLTEDRDESQKSEPSRSSASPVVAQKKRRLDPGDDELRSFPIQLSSPSQGSPNDGTSSAQSLDSIVPPQMQRLCLRQYMDDYVRVCPLVKPTGDCSFEVIRIERPILLHAIVFAACPGLLPDQMQEDVSQAMLHTLAHKSIAEGEKSMEILQALLIVTAWFRSPAKHKHLAAAQLIAIAEGMAIDLGIANPTTARFSLTTSTHDENIDTVEAAATYIVCHLLSTLLSDLSRRTPRNPWSTYHDTCLLFLTSSQSRSPSYSWLIHYCRSERLCARISSELELSDSTKVHEISDHTFQQRLQHCSVLISEWKILLPSTLYIPDLLMWEHVATAYMYETLLHTATNKQSFAAPFTPERIAALDFPRPIIREEHIPSLLALRSALHTIIDLYTCMDTTKIMALPVLSFTARALYALFMLLKLYVATTAPGNTYGSVIPPDSLQLQAYLEKVISLWKRLAPVDARSGPARVTSAAGMLKEYYLNYLGSNFGLASSTAATLAMTSGSGNGTDVNDSLMTMATDLFDYDAIDWSLYYPLPTDDDDLLFDGAGTTDLLQAVSIPDAIGLSRDLVNAEYAL